MEGAPEMLESLLYCQLRSQVGLAAIAAAGAYAGCPQPPARDLLLGARPR